MLSGYEHLHIN